jgi:CheY-like chemotaxis protein
MLVVDDDRVNRTLVSSILRRMGFHVVTASDGNEAIAAFRKHYPSVGLVFLDVEMPGVDGPATLRILRAIDPKVRACFVGGGTGNYTKDELLAMGAVGFLEKPVTPEKFADLFGVRV